MGFRKIKYSKKKKIRRQVGGIKIYKLAGYLTCDCQLLRNDFVTGHGDIVPSRGDSLAVNKIFGKPE
jgi:hypothetical protein